MSATDKTTRQKRTTVYKGTVSAIVLTCALGAVASAQDGGGLLATFDIGQSLQWESNSDLDRDDGDSEVLARTNLGFGLSSTTRTRTFGFSADGVLEFGDDDEDTFTDPSVRLNYGVENRNAELTTNFSYRESDLNRFVLEDEFTGVDLIFDDGTREDVRASVGLELGRQAPFGFTLDASLADRTFNDTADPDLFDTERRGVTLGFRFDIQRNLTATLQTRYNELESDGTGTDRETRGVTAGLDLAVNPGLTVGASVNYNDVDLEEQILGERVDSNESGVGFGLSAVQALPNGQLTGNFDTSVAENGRRTSIRVGRSYDLRDGGLTLSFGLSQTEDLDLAPLFGLDYIRELPEGSIGVSFSQSVTADGDNDEVLRSRLGVDYQRAINSISSWNAGLGLNATTQLNDESSEEDRIRIDLNASYRRDIGQDWDLVSGYRFSSSDTDNTVTSNEVFLTVERSFSWRP